MEVGARAVRLIRSVYEGYLENEDVEALRKRSDSRKESQKRIRYVSLLMLTLQKRHIRNCLKR